MLRDAGLHRAASAVVEASLLTRIFKVTLTETGPNGSALTLRSLPAAARQTELAVKKKFHVTVMEVVRR
jgi:hypothetical protein